MGINMISIIVAYRVYRFFARSDIGVPVDDFVVHDGVDHVTIRLFAVGKSFILVMTSVAFVACSCYIYRGGKIRNNYVVMVQG